MSYEKKLNEFVHIFMTNLVDQFVIYVNNRDKEEKLTTEEVLENVYKVEKPKVRSSPMRTPSFGIMPSSIQREAPPIVNKKRALKHDTIKCGYVKKGTKGRPNRKCENFVAVSPEEDAKIYPFCSTCMRLKGVQERLVTEKGIDVPSFVKRLIPIDFKPRSAESLKMLDKNEKARKKKISQEVDTQEVEINREIYHMIKEGRYLKNHFLYERDGDEMIAIALKMDNGEYRSLNEDECEAFDKAGVKWRLLCKVEKSNGKLDEKYEEKQEGKLKRREIPEEVDDPLE